MELNARGSLLSLVAVLATAWAWGSLGVELRARREGRERTMRDQDGVDFSCSLARGQDELRIEYRITNRTKAPVVALVHLPSVAVDGTDEFYPRNANIDLDGSTLRILKGAAPMPERFNVDDYTIPYGQEIAPGAELAETMVLALPVKVSHRVKRTLLLREGDVEPTKKSVARAVEVAVGVLPEDAPCFVGHAGPVHPELRTAGLPYRVPGCQTVLSKRFDLDADLPVLDYQVTPWR